MGYVLMYLAAIVAANLTVAMWGPGVTVINALLFVGLDLTARDKLHDAWHGNGLVWKMGALIATGSILSWALNQNAAQIALASFVAFAAASVVDTAAYHMLRRRAWWQRVNGSNALSAAVDSVLFPQIAFGAFLPLIVVGQFAAKVLGGAVWSWILGKGRKQQQEVVA